MTKICPKCQSKMIQEYFDSPYKCLDCGHIQTYNDFIKSGSSKEDAQGMVGFSCIGRITNNCKGELGNKKQPCNYAGGGLFKLNPIKINYPDGNIFESFDFEKSLCKEDVN